MSAPIRPSVSGTGQKPYARRRMVHCSNVIDDGEQTVDLAIQPPVVNSKEEFIEAVKQSGLVILVVPVSLHISS